MWSEGGEVGKRKIYWIQRNHKFIFSPTSSHPTLESTNAPFGVASSSAAGGKAGKLGESKLLSNVRYTLSLIDRLSIHNISTLCGLTPMYPSRFDPLNSRCKECKRSLHSQNVSYCQTCAYKKGLCSMCGVKILDISRHALFEDDCGLDIVKVPFRLFCFIVNALFLFIINLSLFPSI